MDIISASQIVQPRLLVEHIPPIAEWISLAQRIGQRAGGTQRLAPCIVLVFYHEGTRTVKQANDIALEIRKIGVYSSVELHFRREALCIVEEKTLILPVCSVSPNQPRSDSINL